MAKKVSLKKSKIQRSDCTKNCPLRRQKSTNKVGCYRSGTVSFQWISTSSSKQLWSTQILFHFNWVGGCEAEAVSLSPPPLLCALLHFYCHRGKSTLASARSFSRTAELFCNCNWEYSWQPTTIWNADLCLLLLEASVKRWWNLKWRRKKAKSPPKLFLQREKSKSDLLHFTFTSPSHFVSHFGALLSTTNFRHRRSRRSANFGCIEWVKHALVRENKRTHDSQL